MRILGHIHTFNDEEVIGRCLQTLLDQTCPLEEIVLVDNGSTDSTLKRSFPEKVTVIRHPDNRGTSGAVITGFQYALQKGYEWIWLFDADSFPRLDALQKLLELYRSFPPDLQEKVWRLSSLPVEDPHGEPRHGIIFTPKGCSTVKPKRELFYECDGTIWSGSLYKVSLVRRVGLPNADYVLDWGEYEYGYLGKQAGFKAYMHTGSIMRHSVGDVDPPMRSYGFGRLSLKIREVDYPPIRLYYIFRNCLYFWFYIYHKGNVYRYLRQPWRSPSFYFLLRWPVRIILLSRNRAPQLKACMRGIWDGLCKNMHHRY